eukprot:NODE_4067_length_700_cov_82.883257_g3441_i0.p1 GENE.NODE_4067_length_700_cov_82.883257_g3441_i0~~NODE_4067_length_700_cov_82.883257_g3441_i0.p1  ORF type:complete len:200 (-),score=36.10 NODE_4067_length_700_cov_82.883257_g3441_i0:63-662(-)
MPGGGGPAYHRSPCPGRIFEDLGVGFSIGCIAGSLMYFGKGFFNAPRRQRFLGGLTHIRNRAPLLGGSFAMWGGVYTSVDCLMIYYRGKDDPYNAIVGGFVTGGVLAIRGGLNMAFKQAMMGGLILALIEGVSTAFTGMMMRQQYQMMEEMQRQQKLEAERLTRKGGKDQWAVDYDKQYDGKSVDHNEAMVDSAKSYSL